MNKITPLAQKLHDALKEKGIECVLEFPDGFKHVDIGIPEAKIYIEVDGPQHLTDYRQILNDFGRNYYSDADGYNTLRIPNEVLENHFEKIVKAIEKVVKKRKEGSRN